MGTWDHVQVWRRQGGGSLPVVETLAGEARVTLDEYGRYPRAVEIDGRTYILENGRYVEAPVVSGTMITSR
jgi:hypothetical protein